MNVIDDVVCSLAAIDGVRVPGTIVRVRPALRQSSEPLWVQLQAGRRINPHLRLLRQPFYEVLPITVSILQWFWTGRMIKVISFLCYIFGFTFWYYCLYHNGVCWILFFINIISWIISVFWFVLLCFVFHIV